MGKVKEILDSITQALDDYVKNTDEAKRRREEHRVTEPEAPTVWTEREKRKKAKEPTGSSWGIYE